VRFSFDPAVIAGLLLVEGLYLRAVFTLRGRGWRVGRWQQVAWHAGWALTAVGLLSPVDSLGEELLFAHMAQHLLIADLAAPLLLVGLRTPVLVHFLPRPALVSLARNRRLRAVFRFIRKPIPAISIWVITLYGWHFSFAFESALDSGIVHALQHESFVFASLLVWWPVLEPKRRRLNGELWKIGHLLGARLAGMMLGMAFLILRAPAYEGFYGDRARAHGLSPLEDQQLAGGLMLTLDIVIMLFALAFFFWRSAVDHDRRERAAAAAS
jgi:cytochrome c oxidase assembly factor CtaG